MRLCVGQAHRAGLGARGPSRPAEGPAGMDGQPGCLPVVPRRRLPCPHMDSEIDMNYCVDWQARQACGRQRVRPSRRPGALVIAPEVVAGISKRFRRRARRNLPMGKPEDELRERLGDRFDLLPPSHRRDGRFYHRPGARLQLLELKSSGRELRKRASYRKETPSSWSVPIGSTAAAKRERS